MGDESRVLGFEFRVFSFEWAPAIAVGRSDLAAAVPSGFADGQEEVIWTESGQAFRGRAKKEEGRCRPGIWMTGASFAQIACPAFTRDERDS
jgi:hypothetical protein